VKRSWLIVGVLLLFVGRCEAIYPVYDAANYVQNVLNYIKAGLAYVKDAEIEVNTNLTVLHQITQIENEILELERMGDPRVLINLPGIEQIAKLQQIVIQAQIDIAKIRAFVSAAGIQDNCDSIMRAYGFSSWHGFTSGWGVKYSCTVPLLQFSTSDYQADSYAQSRVQQLMTQKQDLLAQRDIAIAGQKAATDDTTKMSYAAQITALNGAIADLDQSINQTLALANIQVRMNGSAQNVFNGMSGLQTLAAFQQQEEYGITALGGTPTGTAPGLQTNGTVVGNSSEFGYIDNPAIGGTGDPGTSGSWDVGAGGANIGSQNSTGISLPLATEVAMFGSESNALGQNVMVTNNATGASTVTQIVDVGPGQSSVAKGNIVDLTYGTAAALGTEGKSTNVTVSKVQ
jgi:hypothetical protein